MADSNVNTGGSEGSGEDVCKFEKGQVRRAAAADCLGTLSPADACDKEMENEKEKENEEDGECPRERP